MNNLKDWKEVRLGDIAEYRTGKLNSNQSELNGEYPFFTCSPEMLRINNFAFDQDAIILAGNNANGVFHLQKYKGKFNAYQRTYIINTLDCNVVSNSFIYYQLFLKLNTLKKVSSGTATRFLTKTIIDSIKFNIPPIEESKKIAAILSSLDDKIELNNRINKNLEETAQAIFKRWFVDFEFPNKDGLPYKSNGGAMVDSEMGAIPDGWRVVQLSELVSLIDNRGKTPPLSEIKTSYPILDVKALSGESRIINFDNCMKYVNEKIYHNWFRSGHPQKNDILMSTVGSLAEMKLFRGNKGCIAQNVVGFRSNKLSPIYLYQYLKFIKLDLISYNIGSVQPSIKVTHIIRRKIIIPKDYILDSFDFRTKNISEMIYLNFKQSEALVTIRNILLPKLMSGQIRVDIDK